MYASVLISYEVKSLDKTFTYRIPEYLNIKIGMKVKVNFGKKEINGFVMSITNSCEEDYEIKDIISIVDDKFLLSTELIKLGYYVKSKTLCSLITAYETMLPKGIKAKSKKSDYAKYISYLIINEKLDIIKEYVKSTKYLNQKEILIDIVEKNKIEKNKYSVSSVNTLIKKGFIKEIKEQVYRINKEESTVKKYIMTDEQQLAFDTLKSSLNKYQTFLLHGVTGSGKTLVYINLIKEVIKQNKTVIMLVPEISLTAQTSKIFYDYFGSDVAVFHSSLSDGEKYDEYLKIANKEVHVVVGTRSAIFTPLDNIGLIIIDEEHSDTYKQDNNPRYNAKEVAIWRSKYHNCPLILGSATPTLESMARAKKNVYTLLEMKNRATNITYPLVKLIDMSLEMQKRNNIFSDELISKIKEKISKEEQVILLLNRRGFSTFITCQNCGFTYKCPHCEISLTYHKSTDSLRCHYCGYTVLKSGECPDCHQKSLNFLGYGTEKVEQELKSIVPESKILRMDADTTANKGMHEKIITSFKDENYNVLLGTQMIAKGLDFPNVTLVGVINADTTLNIPDYKSNENTFALLNQVAGRSGRGHVKGEVILQTFNPDNFTLNCVKNNDYFKYYNYEMNIRKTLLYPPFIFLGIIRIVGKDYEMVSKEANKVSSHLKRNLVNNEIILGPTTANVFKINNNYRFQIIVKYKKEKEFLNVLQELDNLYKLNKQVYLEIDLNPSRL